MKIRRDTVFISSVLFTIALLCLLPPFLKGAASLLDTAGRQELDLGWRLYSEMWAEFDVACLAIVLIGLIVIWGGYIKKLRWAWFVMFVIVWGWFFPTVAWHDFMSAISRGLVPIKSIPVLLLNVFGSSGLARNMACEMLIFVLMVVALLLPVKSFFWDTRKQSK